MMFEVIVDYWWQFLLLAVCSYLFANINFAVVFSKLFKHSDIREHGSGNAGAANMMRVYGAKLGALTFVCDVLKGVLPCVLARFAIFPFVSSDPNVAMTAGYVAALFAIVGHIFPVFFRFKGGKGVATAIGAFFTLQPILALCLVLPCLALLFAFDRTSIVSLFISVFMIVWGWCAWRFEYNWKVLYTNIDLLCCVLNTLIFALVIFVHRKNIVRLCTGTENRSGIRKALRSKFRKKSPDEE